MDDRVFRETIRRIVRRTFPYAAALALGSGAAACECPVETLQEERQTTLRDDAWVRAVSAAGADGSLPAELCAELCDAVTSGYRDRLLACRLPDPPTGGADAGGTADAGGAPDAGAGEDVASPPAEVQGTIACTVEFEQDCGGVGRRPEGLQATATATTGGPVGRYYAEACAHEAGAAEAFRLLAADLARHGAPPALLADARRAEADERRHALLTRFVCDRWSGSPRAAVVPDTRGRGLADIARDNAAEGCVEETYGAALAWWQSEHAADPAIRAVMRVVAEEESAHAAWSWRLHEWARPRLAPAERAAVDDALARAVAELAERASRPRDAALVTEAGLPAPDVARHLYAALRAELWHRAAA